MSRIRVLDDHVANQIAAGEVVDRPASVVKELVENSLDAGATRVAVHLKAGGRDLVAVEDDGAGMDEDDALLCFERHATSKLHKGEDLLAIGTLGFRGEALPSIASVARVVLRTRARDAETGTEVVLRGGTVDSVQPIAWPGGTTIEVRSLFFNTPARRKFLRTEATELRHITAMLTRLALARPDVHFRCTHNERELLHLPPYAERLERIAAIYGTKLARSLTRIERAAGPLALEGFLGPLHDTKSSTDYQQTFVNGRAVRSPVLSAAVQEAFHLVLPKGRLPVAILYLTMPPFEVDVNVHPTKAEVRFHSPGAVRQFVADAIREHLGAGARGMLPEVGLGRGRTDAIRVALDSVYPPESRGGWASAGAASPPLADAAGQQSAPSSGAPEGGGAPEHRQAPAPGAAPAWTAEQVPFETAWMPSPLREPMRPAAPLREAAAGSPAGLAGLRYIGQLANTFLLLEDEEGLLIVDQHVAHERVRVEQLIDGVRSGSQAVQPLLMPEVVELDPAACLALEKGRAALGALGFEIDVLDAGSVAVRSAPAVLPLGDLEETVRLLARRLQDEGGRLPDAAELIEETLVMAACKGAIKAHDPLTPEQAHALLEQLDRTRHPFSCPHGRPAYFRLPLVQIERELGRLGFA
jgi:DNA mismatch repair protein MutL